MMNNQAGDTLVEVLLSIAVISMVLAGAINISNRATRNNQSAIERTTVSNLMREQIEQVRGIRNRGYGLAAWDEVESYAKNSSPTFDRDICSPGSGAFFIERTASDYDDPSIVKAYSGADANPADLFTVWIELYDPGNPVDNNYYDVHVLACWEGIGGDVDNQRASAVLRIRR